MAKKRTIIPYQANQEKVSIEIKRWDKYNEEPKFDLIIKTENSYVSHSLSYKQMKLLKDAIQKQNI